MSVQNELLNEIRSFYPHWLTELKEFEVIFAAQSKMLSKCENAVQMLKNDCTLSKCSEKRLDELIAFFKLQTEQTMSMNSKRTLLKTAFIVGKTNESIIKDIVRNFLDADCTVSINGLKMTITIIDDNADTANLDLCIRELRKKLNCSIGLLIERQSAVSVKTYAGISISEYKKEVLN